MNDLGSLDYSLHPEGFKAYGAALEVWNSKHPEVILSGPYETGKTFATMHKFHLLLSKYPNSRGLIVKKSYKSLVQTALVTFEENNTSYSTTTPFIFNNCLWWI